MTDEGDSSRRVDDEVNDLKALWLALRDMQWDLKFSDVSRDHHSLSLINH